MKNNLTNYTIVQVTPYYPPHLGGMENYVKQLVEHLQKRSVKVKVFTSDRGIKTNDQKDTAISYLKSIEFAHTPIMFSLFFKLLLLPKRSIIHVHISQALTPEVVYLVSKIRKIPYVCHMHCDVESSGPFGFLLQPYKKLFLSQVIQSSSRIICITENQKQVIVQKYNLDACKVAIIPNGISKEFFMERRSSPKTQFRILFVGRLVMGKNISLLLKSIALVRKNIVVDIVGDGEMANNLKQLAESLQLHNVVFHGRKTGQELQAFYQNADMFLLTSNAEVMSMALLEAMAAGLPIVVTNIPGVREVLGNAAVIVANAQPSTVARAIDQLLSDGDLRETLAREAQKCAKKYTWENIMDTIISLYLNLAQSSGSPLPSEKDLPN